MAMTIENIAEKKQNIIAWLEDSVHGTFCAACEANGVSKSLGYIWKKEDQQFSVDVRKALDQAIESGKDFVEGKLRELIEKSNPTAIIFYLKCLGKDRGYIDRLMIGTDPENPLTVTHVHRASEDFRQVLSALASSKATGSELPLTLDQQSETEPDNTTRRLAHLDDHGGERLGEDAHGG